MVWVLPRIPFPVSLIPALQPPINLAAQIRQGCATHGAGGQRIHKGAAILFLPQAAVEHHDHAAVGGATDQAAGLGHMGVVALTSICYPAFIIYTMNLAPAAYRSAMSGAGEMAAGISFALMALAGGYLIADQGYTNLFLLGAAATTLGTLILWASLCWRRLKP